LGDSISISLATLASETVFTRAIGVNPDLSKIMGFLLAGGLTVLGGVLGFKVIMKIQFYLTIITLVLTLGYIALTIDQVNWSAVSAITYRINSRIYWRVNLCNYRNRSWLGWLRSRLLEVFTAQDFK
jgi:purine-cytosine permease-like protein